MSLIYKTTGAILGVMVAGGAMAASMNETVLHTFVGGADGASPNSRLLFAANGLLYGTTSAGGGGTACDGGCGTVFQLAPAGTNSAETVLYAFQDGADGSYPFNQNLVADANGNLYGVTQYGGAYGTGVVFELSPPQDGKSAWTEKPLYSFPGGKAGAVPQTYLLMGAGGVLYGTTSAGGTTGCGGGGCGNVFSLAPPANGHGKWKLKVLHIFRGGKGDGATPQSGPIADAAGDLYGNTSAGGGVGCGGVGCGTVYELAVPTGQSGWHETILHKFNKKANGLAPVGNLLFGDGGVLYGSAGGGLGKCGGPIIFGCGVDFELAPPTKAGAAWTETVLHASRGKVDGYYDGSYPNGDFIPGADGAIVSGTYGGGLPQFAGTVFQLQPGQNGQPWTETILYAFAGGADGSGAQGGLTSGAGGVLFGVTVGGGTANLGTLYELSQ